MNPFLINPLFLKGAALILLVGFAYWKVNGWVDDYQAMKTEHQQTVQQLMVERNSARIEAESAKAALQEKELNEERLELLLADALRRQDEIRAEARIQKKVFEDHDLQKLTDAKPGLIEKLANKATQERMDAFEDALNQ